jgi:preprotein translocase subunit SecG
VLVITSLLLMLVVLLQEPKGGGLSAAFGGAGGEAFGVQAGGVNKFTTWVAGIFMGIAVLYAAIKPEAPAAPTDRVREFAPMEDGIGAGTEDGVLPPDSGDGDE